MDYCIQLENRWSLNKAYEYLGQMYDVFKSNCINKKFLFRCQAISSINNDRNNFFFEGVEIMLKYNMYSFRWKFLPFPDFLYALININQRTYRIYLLSLTEIYMPTTCSVQDDKIESAINHWLGRPLGRYDHRKTELDIWIWWSN